MITDLNQTLFAEMATRGFQEAKYNPLFIKVIFSV